MYNHLLDIYLAVVLVYIGQDVGLRLPQGWGHARAAGAMTREQVPREPREAGW